jgi:type IV secretory pathway protease TraF
MMGRTGKAATLASTQYYVLGDAAISCDSRTFGPITRSEIVAKAVFRYAPFGRISFL